MTMLTGEDNIRKFRNITLLKALKLEILGMSRGGRSAYSIIKEEQNLTGTKQNVYKKFEAMINEGKDKI